MANPDITHFWDYFRVGGDSPAILKKRVSVRKRIDLDHPGDERLRFVASNSFPKGTSRLSLEKLKLVLPQPVLQEYRARRFNKAEAAHGCSREYVLRASYTGVPFDCHLGWTQRDYCLSEQSRYHPCEDYPSPQKWDQMIAAYEAHGRPSEWKPLENSIRDVCLSVRRMAEVRGDTYKPYFDALPVDYRLSKFAEQFLTYSASALEPWVLDMTTALGHVESGPSVTIRYRWPRAQDADLFRT